jgi:hypothetical protein
MNLKESVRQWVLKALPYDRANVDLLTHLNGLDAHRLLVVYHNWINRLVKPQPRVVHKSKAFLQNPKTMQRASDLAQLIADIEQGRDLTKYLSRGIVRAPAGIPGQDRRPDLDLMLNDWGVHHLHISSIIEADGFVKRDGPLLFVSFKPDAAYLIDIMTHRDWARDHVLEVLAAEWPDKGVIHEVKGALGLKNSVMGQRRATARRKHLNTQFEFQGKVFMPIGFMSSAGTTFAATREADKLLDRVAVFERELAGNPRGLAADFEKHGLVFPAAPEFEFAIREDGYGVIETKTRAWINLTGNQCS